MLFDIIKLMIFDEVDIRIYKHKKLIFTEAMSSNDIYRYCYFVSFIYAELFSKLILYVKVHNWP